MRPRKNKADQKLPPRVYRGKSAYEYHPKGGGAIRLCGLDAALSIVWRNYEALLAQQPVHNSFKAIADKYLTSAQHKEKARVTQKGYEKHCKRLTNVFGHMAADKIQPKHIRQYLDKRGRQSKSLANHEVRTLSVIFSYAYERGMVKSNPRKGVKLFTEKPRDKYIEQHEYQAVYDHAPPMIKAAMEIAYRCGARKADIIKLTRFDVKDDGLFIWQQKTGKKQIKEWTKELRAAIDSVISDKSQYIIHTSSGGRYTSDGFDSAWQRTKAKAKTASGLELNFTFHDLKARGVSDYEGDKKKFSGHESDRMVQAVYNRKPEISPTIGTKENKKLS